MTAEHLAAVLAVELAFVLLYVFFVWLRRRYLRDQVSDPMLSFLSMPFLFFLFAVVPDVVGAIPGAVFAVANVGFLLFYMSRSDWRRRRAWERRARELGLDVTFEETDGTTTTLISGSLDGFGVTVEESKVSECPAHTEIAVDSHGRIPRSLSLTPLRGLFNRRYSRYIDGKALRTGDLAFERKIAACGDDRAALALSNAETRARVVRDRAHFSVCKDGVVHFTIGDWLPPIRVARHVRRLVALTKALSLPDTER